MKSSINTEELRDMFLAVAQKIVDSENFLTEIDIKIGDGDHGIGMAVGFKEVLKQLPESHFSGTEDVFKTVGTILLDTMGGASGVLFGTMFISGIIKRPVKQEMTLLDFAGIFRKSLDALKQRGKAQIGDKTMVDAFEPAVIALEESERKGLSLTEGLQAAAAKAKDGMEYTKEVVARFGRAKSYGEKSIGLQDAGATSVWIIYQEMADWATKNLS